MLRQSARGLRASLRNSDALSKALADEFSLTGSISARGTRPVASHGENIPKYHSITSQCKFEVRNEKAFTRCYGLTERTF